MSYDDGGKSRCGSDILEAAEVASAMYGPCPRLTGPMCGDVLPSNQRAHVDEPRPMTAAPLSPESFDDFCAAHQERMTEYRPTGTMVRVAQLPMEGALVYISAIAAR